VLLAARLRRSRTTATGEAAELVTEILTGRAPRPLPSSVAAALEGLRAATASEPGRRPALAADATR